MQSLMLFILSATGLTWILCDSGLFKPFRELISKKYTSNKNIVIAFLDGILNCHGCCGLWAGLFCYPFLYQIQPMWILFGFAGSFSALILIALYNMIKRVK